MVMVAKCLFLLCVVVCSIMTNTLIIPYKALKVKCLRPFQQISPNEEITIDRKVAGIIDLLTEHTCKYGFPNNIDPSILVENAHVLAKSGVYEQLIAESIEQARGEKHLDSLRKVDAFLRGFIQTERKQRARIKVKYILAGAESNRADEAIQMLVHSDEIDDELMMYLRSLIRAAEDQEGLGSRTAAQQTAQDSPEIADTKEIKATQSIDVLRLILKRLEVERKSENKESVQLLSRLLSCRDPQEQRVILKEKLMKIEALESFHSFIQDGVWHLTSRAQQSGPGTTPHSSESPTAEKAAAETELPADIIQRMRDILGEVDGLRDKLRTGYDEESTYSTSISAATATGE